MAKNEFARGTLTFNLTDYGIFDVTIDMTYSEIDVTDTKSTVTQSEFLGGKQVINISFTMYKDAGTADLLLNRTTTSQTSGSLTEGIAYRLTDWITNDDFTNVGAASNADGVEFIATGTVPTTWTNSSIVNTMVECTLTVEDSSGNYTTYEGDLILLTKSITGNVDGAVQLAYTGKITGDLTEAQG
jgi:hypothetical protein